MGPWMFLSQLLQWLQEVAAGLGCTDLAVGLGVVVVEAAGRAATGWLAGRQPMWGQPAGTAAACQQCLHLRAPAATSCQTTAAFRNRLRSWPPPGSLLTRQLSPPVPWSLLQAAVAVARDERRQLSREAALAGSADLADRLLTSYECGRCHARCPSSGCASCMWQRCTTATLQHRRLAACRCVASLHLRQLLPAGLPLMLRGSKGQPGMVPA